MHMHMHMRRKATTDTERAASKGEPNPRQGNVVHRTMRVHQRLQRQPPFPLSRAQLTHMHTLETRATPP